MNTVKVRETAPKKSVPITPFLEVTPSPKKSPYHSPQKIGLGNANIILIYLAFCTPPVKIEAETRPTGAKPRRRTLCNLNFGAFCAHPCRSQHLEVLGAAGTNTTHFYFSFSFDNLLFLSFVSPSTCGSAVHSFFFLFLLCHLYIHLFAQAQLAPSIRDHESPHFSLFSLESVHRAIDSFPPSVHRARPIQRRTLESPPPSQTKQKLWNKYRNWP